MSFKRHVEIGRVCLISFGPDMDKLCTVVNVIDNNRVLVDGPEPVTGVHRHAINIGRLQLTDLKVKCKLNASEKELKAVWTSDGIMAKWEETSQGKKRKVRAMRASTNDFERFQIQVAKSKRSAIRKSK